MNFNTILGNKIKSLRDKNNLSQNDFCNNLNISITRASLSKIESGKQMPSAEIIKDIIEVYNISPYWLLDIKEDEYKKYINKYETLNLNDKETINTMIDHLYNKKTNLSSLMNIEKEKDNKISS